MRFFIPLTLLLVCTVCACESPFPPSTLVERLRILGVRAQPPEADPFGEVQLSALVADPQGEGRPLHTRWAVCLVELGPVSADIECPGGESYPIEAEGLTATLSMPDLVAWLAEKGFDLDDLPENLPVDDLPLYVGFEVVAGSERTRAIKRISVSMSLNETSNTNPVLVGLEADGQVVSDQVMGLTAGAEVDLVPLSDEGTRQTYRRKGEEQDRVEDFLFSWFSTAGEFGDRRTILDVDSDGNPLDENEWTLPEETGPATLWLVVRDGRFGIDWLEFQFDIR
jgi:hypothetical protein